MCNLLTRRNVLSASAAALGSAMVAPLASAAAQPFFQRAKLAIGLELYTVAWELRKDFDGTLARMAEIGYRDVEANGYYERSPADVRAALDRHGLVCRSLHVVGLPGANANNASLTDVQKVIDDAGTLGATHVVMVVVPVPRPPGAFSQQAFAQSVRNLSADDWKACAAMLNEKGAAVAKAGLTIGYHNHNAEFAPLGDTTPFEILLKETDPAHVVFEMDVGWVAAAGLDPVALLNKHRGRFRLMHVKDLKASTATNYDFKMDPADVGTGKLDWAKILPAAHKSGVRHFFVEQEPPFPPAGPVVSAENAYRYLSQLKA